MDASPTSTESTMAGNDGVMFQAKEVAVTSSHKEAEFLLRVMSLLFWPGMDDLFLGPAIPP